MSDNAKVLAALARLRETDSELAGELDRKLRRSQREVARVEELPSRAGRLLTQETIVLRSGRPVLAISHDKAELIFEPADSKTWKRRLTDAFPVLTPAIRAVGRVEVSAHPKYTWIGTGWLVSEAIIVTNRHVAREFARWNGQAFVFRAGTFGYTMGANIDFLEEAGRATERAAKVVSILHVEDEDGPDLAFLRVESPSLTPPIRLAEAAAKAKQYVAVIGYPARDSRIPEPELMDRIFGNIYDKKRLAPGQVSTVAPSELQHDCSTLGGNSGSVVLDLASGTALGLHFAGRFLEANYAVPASVIAERLHAAHHGSGRHSISVPNPSRGMGPAISPNRISFAIPLQVTLQVEPLTSHPTAVVVPGPAAPIAVGATPPGNVGEAEPFDEERTAADYRGRRGYDPRFLGRGKDLEVPLPRVVKHTKQVLRFAFNGNPKETVLKYEHFSVVMRKDRRMCFFSAVNINGKLSRRTKRTGWLFDPRIPSAVQIRDECYGNAPKFSRGHMTRREDPIWGTLEEAAQGNTDSMHVTNTVPQIQTFNAGIWLKLEDYALENTRQDDMKVCVFTGPVLREDDPVRFGVQIPRVFWKVIAFVHDQERRLSATGYSLSQEKLLTEVEFVFGAYETYQRPLRWIGKHAGLDFGRLMKIDLFEDIEERALQPLTDFRQIRFFGVK